MGDGLMKQAPHTNFVEWQHKQQIGFAEQIVHKNQGGNCDLGCPLLGHAYPHSSAAIVCDLTADTEATDGTRQG